MSGEKSEIELSQWFSTYGVITAERVFGRYQIKLAPADLITAIKSPFSFYHKVLKIPLKHVLNGIILQQANDYHVYVQKLFIDYLLSGENAKEEDAQGANTREALEKERQLLVTLGEEYHKKEGGHSTLIAHSQNILIKITREFNAALEKAVTGVTATLKNAASAQEKSKVRQAINHALIFCDLTEPQLQSNQFLFVEKINEILKLKLTEDLNKKIMDNVSEMFDIVTHFDENVGEYVAKTEEMNVFANSFRSQFYNTILRVVDLIKLLPEYKIDPVQDEVNRESLYFDKSIGAL